MLMLVAGSHVRLDGQIASGVRSAAIAFLVVLAAAIPVGLVVAVLLAPSAPAVIFPVLLAGSSAAVAFPILEERGLLGPSVGLLLVWIPLADAVTVSSDAAHPDRRRERFRVLLAETLRSSPSQSERS